MPDILVGGYNGLAMNEDLIIQDVLPTAEK